jgi:hypothetical protein
MNFDEIVEDVYSKLGESDKQWLLAATEAQVRGLHYYTGMSIRNTYGLWDPTHVLTTNWANNPESRDMRDGVDYSNDHPDAVSNEILAAIWRKANQSLNSPTKIK